jgi:surfactin synthase thioesterase subunit
VTARRSRWLVGRLPQPGSRHPALVVVPPGSAGPEAAVGWLDRLVDLDVSIVQLPGRGQRLFEEPATDLGGLAAALAGELVAALPDRFAVLGHCSGAFLGLEMAHRLHAARQSPERLFISSSRSPAELADPDSDHARAAVATAAITDEQLIDKLTRRGCLTGGHLEPEYSVGAQRNRVWPERGGRPPIRRQA